MDKSEGASRIMNTLLALIRKEFIQIFRNKVMLPIIFIMPLIQLLILANAATYELKNVDIVVVDQDRSAASRQLKQAFVAGGFFSIRAEVDQTNQALDLIQSNDADVVIVIPPRLSERIRMGQPSTLQLMISGEDGMKAGLIQSYVAGIMQKQSILFQQELIPINQASTGLVVRELFAYNPELRYTYYMVPGILVLLVTMIGLLLSAMNIVREKEIGTIEQLNVTPIKRWQFISGKLIPFWIIGLFELALGLTIAWLVFNIPMEGSLLLVFGAASIYLIIILSIGLLISTVTDTQQQAMFIAWFVMVLFILMSGLFTPVQSMPEWAQMTTLVNPLTYFIEIMRRVLLKGATFESVETLMYSLAIYATLLLGIAVRRYRKIAR